MNFRQMKAVIEGLLFVAGDEGMDPRQIAEVLEQDIHIIADLLQDMKGDYKRQGRGIQLIEIAGAFQLTTLPSHALYFERLAHSPTRATLSQAGLETLAIVAYKQPITRVELEDIRGVKSDRALRTLAAKGLIKEVGRAEALGRPILYGTTQSFLEYFALNHLQDLPESSVFENNHNLEDETKLLFEKLAIRQISMDDLEL